MNTERFAIQLRPKRRTPLTISEEADRHTAITKARELGVDGAVLDRQTGKVFLIRLETWTKPRTAAIILGDTPPVIPARLLNDLGFGVESFSAEGC